LTKVKHHQNDIVFLNFYSNSQVDFQHMLLFVYTSTTKKHHQNYMVFQFF
jgi:hypothetical protein